MYMKRQMIKKTWPVPRKGTKYVVRASHYKKDAIPLLIILRDILKIAENRKEVRKILNSGSVIVNEKIRKKEDFPVLAFDVLKIGDKNYQLVFSDKGKFKMEESEEKNKVFKIVGRKILKKKKIQLNLLHGANLIIDEKEKVNMGDSVIIKDKKIEKIIPLEQGREAVIISGKNMGKIGKIEKIEEKIAGLVIEDKKINVPIRNILVLR